jgi:hypothetical protein
MDAEEQIVAELETAGVCYLSRHTDQKIRSKRPPYRLLADLVCQPSSRVRLATIALLLAQPSYAQSISEALEILPSERQFLLMVLYSAAVFLQQVYRKPIEKYQGRRWHPLPDIFSTELNIPLDLPPQQRLAALGRLYRSHSGVDLNWSGTFDNAARHWLRQVELEERWQVSQPQH